MTGRSLASTRSRGKGKTGRAATPSQARTRRNIIIYPMSYTKRPDAELLQAALAGYQHQHVILGERIAEITRELGGRGRHLDAAGGAKPKRTMSAAARRRIGAAQRKRWAAVKGATGTPAKKAARKAKRHMSAEGRERIAEATRKRWEAYRAAKK